MIGFHPWPDGEKPARRPEQEGDARRGLLARGQCAFAAAGLLLAAAIVGFPAVAQQSGGVLKVGHFTSPASMSMLEESTVAVNRPISGVFNNLVMFKQDEPQNNPDSIIPELATSRS